MKHLHPARKGNLNLDQLTTDDQILLLKETFGTPGAVSPVEDLIGTLEQQAKLLQQQATTLQHQARALQLQELRELPQNRNGIYLKAHDLDQVAGALIGVVDNIITLARANLVVAMEEAAE